MTLTPAEGGTLLSILITYPSAEVRDMVLGTGMTDGMETSYARLEGTSCPPCDYRPVTTLVSRRFAQCGENCARAVTNRAWVPTATWGCAPGHRRVSSGPARRP